MRSNKASSKKVQSIKGFNTVTITAVKVLMGGLLSSPYVTFNIYDSFEVYNTLEVYT